MNLRSIQLIFSILGLSLITPVFFFDWTFFIYLSLICIGIAAVIQFIRHRKYTQILGKPSSHRTFSTEEYTEYEVLKDDEETQKQKSEQYRV
ncbi:hypothetical protein QA612_08145 [Evansella sp. AB-P1]|uniref:hypothetical protein n=1 Tax=Evansella sp. AB-P1 TaxID=3037653 RepID=UPI00241E1F89|nr:hypothetical protein [Evansella sp. AB-P1]MDG5787464.1 hypothetical protein [Evansella sp. AB-P1]